MSPSFEKAQHKTHLFLLRIAADWLAAAMRELRRRKAVLDLSAARAVVETRVRRGFAARGGLIVLLDEGYGLYLLHAGKGGAPPWFAVFSAVCPAVLPGIGLCLFLSRELRESCAADQPPA